MKTGLPQLLFLWAVETPHNNKTTLFPAAHILIFGLFDERLRKNNVPGCCHVQEKKEMQSPFDQSSTDQSPADQSPANLHIRPDQHPHDDWDVRGSTTEIQENGSPLRLTSQEHYVVQGDSKKQLYLMCIGFYNNDGAALFDISVAPFTKLKNQPSSRNRWNLPVRSFGVPVATSNKFPRLPTGI